MRPRDYVPEPDFEIPDLTEQQRQQMGLPADFWTAFDQYFRGIVPGGFTEAHAKAVERFCQLTEVGSEENFDCDLGWSIAGLTPSSVRLHLLDGERVVDEIVYTSPTIVSAATEMYELLEASRRAQQLADVRDGGPAWMFLPPKPGGNAVDWAWNELDRALTEQRRSPSEAAGQRVIWAKQLLQRRRAEARWPGDGLPPSLSSA